VVPEMTEDEVVAQIRSIQRRCSGPLKFGVEDQRHILSQFDAYRRGIRWEDALRFIASTETRVGITGPEVVVEDWPALQDRFLRAARARSGCGADFNEIVVSGPLDGEEHGYVCPRCGNTGTYRAPHFVVQEHSVPS